MTDAQVSRASADLLPSEHIQGDIVRIALDKVEGIPFEQFANRLKSDLTHQYMATGAARRPAPLDLAAARDAENAGPG